jgi:CMP-N-acetylneuraminic acid synthetase
MRVVALIPLRAGSKRIPGKNTKEIAGKPLCHWVIEAALEANGIEEVWVSTEDEKIASVAERAGAKIHMRPKELAGDDILTESVMREFCMKQSVPGNMIDWLVTIQATNPLVTPRMLEDGVMLCTTVPYGSIVTVSEAKRAFYWIRFGATEWRPVNYQPDNRPPHNLLNPLCMENGAFYVTDVRAMRGENWVSRLPHPSGRYLMPPWTSTELDEPEDWPIVEVLLKEHRCK